MDDGTKDGNGLRLYTYSFSKEEVLLLIKVLEDKFNIQSTLNIKVNKYYYIYIRVGSMDKLRSLVSTYFIESMLYKIT